MQSWTKRSFIFCLLATLFLSVNVAGQVAASHPSDGGGPGGESAAPAASSNVPSRTAHSNDTFLIGDDDVLTISVWKEPEISKDVTVRSDGKISLPLAGELQAAGKTPPQLEQDITARLRGYIQDPEVTVIVKEINSQKYNILGLVTKPGSYPLIAGMTVVDAIATAGGFRDFAKRKSMYILRENPQGGEPLRIPFNYEKFIKGKGSIQDIQLQQHDTIVVP